MREEIDNKDRKEGNDDLPEPNIFFKTFIEGLQPGRILVPAEGEGKNAVFAESRGWEVNAFDFSFKARKKAIEMARRNEIRLDYFGADIEFHQLEDEMYDVIALIRVQFQPHSRAYIHKKLVNSLKKGGYFLVEAYSKDQINTDGPVQETLYDISYFLSDFKELEIENLYNAEIEAGEGTAPARAGVIRMVGMKPQESRSDKKL